MAHYEFNMGKTCKEPDCTSKARVKGLCHRCYMKKRKQER